MNKPLISLGQSRREVNARWGEVERFQQIAEGEESRAFSFWLAGQGYVLRIGRSVDGYAKDAFVHRMFGSARLPVPEVMLIDRLTNGDALCITRLAPGETLQALKDAELTAAVGSVVDILDVMGAVDASAITGYGRFGPDGIATHSSWQGWVGDIAARPHVEGVADWVSRVKLLAGTLPEPHQLVHGDFGSNNVLVQDGVVSGVIDWSESMIGDGLYDVANILFWRTWLGCMEEQARYFESQEPARLADRPRLLCYQLRIGLQLLDEAAREDDAAMVRWIGKRCAEIAAS